MKKATLLFGYVCAILLSASTTLAEQSYMFCVHPFRGPQELRTMFMPLVRYLSSEIGSDVHFRSAKNYDDAMQLLLNGDVQFSYLGPAMFAKIDSKYPGKIRIAAAVVNKDKTPTFRGVIVARDGSQINSLSDLKGKRFAFGDHESTLSCFMPAYMLIQEGVFDSVQYSFVGSHSNVAKGVLNGMFDAGGLKPGVAEKYLNNGLKIIAASEPLYEHMIVVGPDVKQEVFEKIQKALLTVNDPKVYKSIKESLTGFAVVQPSDYDNLKTIISTVETKISQ